VIYMKLFDFFRPSSNVESSSELHKIANEKILASLLVMAWVVEARDPYTGGHLWRVSRYARLLADHAGLPQVDAARVMIGGFLHDLGKVGIPDAILNKKDKLTDEEYDVIKTHPEVGRRMLSGHPFSALALDAVFLHHETPDGRGYPNGLGLDKIPDVARIVGICDAFDAMTSTRPYRSGMPVDRAMRIIEENLGRQFDQKFGALFIELQTHPDLLHIVGHTDSGIPLQNCGMCGPTVVLQRNSKPGDIAYCRCCTGEYTVQRTEGGFHIAPTGAKGNALQLETRPDEFVIGDLVTESANIINLGGLMQAS